MWPRGNWLVWVQLWWSPAATLRKSATAVARIIGETGNRAVRYLLADLSSQGDVRRLADQVKEQMPRLDVLVNNAGALFISHRRSADGIEMT